MSEPVKTEPNPAGQGRPVISESQYDLWLAQMTQYLRAGNTLWYAMEKTGLLGHKDSIYEKYRLKDWFSEKIDILRRTPGEMVNNIFFMEIERIYGKHRDLPNKPLEHDEIEVMKFMAEKHRTSQAFFVNRTETAEADPQQVGKILDDIEGQTDYAAVGREASKQVVAANPPVQNQEQAGANSNVSTEQPAAPASGGTGSPPVQPNS